VHGAHQMSVTHNDIASAMWDQYQQVMHEWLEELADDEDLEIDDLLPELDEGKDVEVDSDSEDVDMGNPCA
jgi:hypothetical protein